MDPLDYAKTPTGRKFGATGSLVGQPSILERRQAVSDMATLNARRSSDYNRVYRQARRASRQGDMEAGLLALELGDLASKEGVELGGIRRYGQRMNAAEDELDQKIRTNKELTDMESGGQPATSGAMTLTAQGWTPNETLATDPVQAQEGIVGGPSGIDATPIRSGPSPAEGGIMAARNRSVSPIYSSRGIEQQTTPQSLDPNYGPPVGSVSTPDREFDKKFPALSAFMKRAGEVDYTMGDTGPDVEQEVANYRWDEQMPKDISQRRMSKRARERAGLPLNQDPPPSVPEAAPPATSPAPSPSPGQQPGAIDMAPRIPVPRVMSNLSQVMGLAPETLDVSLSRASRAIDAVAGAPRATASGVFDLAKKAHERVVAGAYDKGILARRKAASIRKGVSNVRKAVRSDFNL